MGAQIVRGKATATRFATKTLTFTGAANLGQAASNATVFSVTGQVLIVALAPFCKTSLTEAGATATSSLGVTGATTLFIAATNSVDIDANEFWVDGTPDANGVAIPAALRDILITDDIIVANAVDDTDGGVVRFDCLWTPLSSDGNVA